MYKLNIKNLISNTLLVVSSVLLNPFSQAAAIDSTKEIVIDSKRQAADLKNKIASYLDDVKITQGSLVITAD